MKRDATVAAARPLVIIYITSNAIFSYSKMFTISIKILNCQAMVFIVCNPLLPVQPICRVQHPHRKLRLILVDQHTDLDLAG